MRLQLLMPTLVLALFLAISGVDGISFSVSAGSGGSTGSNLMVVDADIGSEISGTLDVAGASIDPGIRGTYLRNFKNTHTSTSSDGLARATVHAEAKDVYGLSYSDWIAKNQVYAAAMQDISFRSAKDVYCYASASTSDGKSRTNDERTAEVSLSMDYGSLASYKGFSYANKDIAYAFQDIDGAVSKARCGQDFGNGIEVISEASDGDNLYRVSTLADTFSGKTYAKGSFAVDSGTSVVTSTSYAKQNIKSASSDDDEAATVINTRYTPALGKQQVTLYATNSLGTIGDADDTKNLAKSSLNTPIIQNMVDLAKSKDTIGIGSGTYYENVKIAKDLTISGAGTCGEAGNCDGACGSCSPCGSCGSCDYTPCGSGCGSSHSSCDYDKGKSGGCGNSYFGDYDKGWSNWNSGSSCGNKDGKGCGDRDYYNYEKDNSKECGESYFGDYDRSWSDWGSCSSSGYGTKCGDDSGDWGDHNSGGCNSGGHGGSGNDCGDKDDHNSGGCNGGSHDNGHDGCGSGSACKVTTIDGGLKGSVFEILGANTKVTLSDMIITNGKAANGGGIKNEGILTVNDAVITKNIADNNGGGIYNAGTLTVTDSTISFNKAGTSSDATLEWRAGGGIYNGVVGILNAKDSCINDNSAISGGGILNFNIANICGTTISGNKASISGGGINTYGGSSNIKNSIICNNEALYGGGIYSASETSIQNSIVSENTADEDGGGITIVEGSSMSIHSSKIHDNSAKNGGGIFSCGTLDIWCSSAFNNVASVNGGGIYNGAHSIATLKYTNIYANEAALYGGGICSWKGSLDISKSRIYGNSANWGGGIATQGEGAQTTIARSSIFGNAAVRTGGGLYVESVAQLNLKDDIVAQNTAGINYGGIRGTWIDEGGNILVDNTP